MLNNVVLVGRITKDPELRSAGTGEVVRFTLAVNRRYKSKDGERQADFINCVAWNQAARFINTYIKKGALLAVTGRIETGSYDGKDGRKVYTTDVVCESVQAVESIKSENASTTYTPKQQKTDFGVMNKYGANPEVNAYSQSETMEFADFDDDFENDTLDISSDALPFE